MPAERFPIQSHRRARRKKAQHIQHALVAVLLIADGIAALSDPHGHHGVAVPILLLVAGALLLGTLGYEQWHHRRHGHHDHHIASYVEIAGAILVFAEAVHRVQGRHHLLFYFASFVAPVLIGALAWAEIRGKTDPYMEIDEQGFVLRMRRLRGTQRVLWKDAKAFRVREEFLEFVREDGGVQRVKIKDVANRAEALQWATARFEQRGLAAQ